MLWTVHVKSMHCREKNESKKCGAGATKGIVCVVIAAHTLQLAGSALMMGKNPLMGRIRDRMEVTTPSASPERSSRSLRVRRVLER